MYIKDLFKQPNGLYTLVFKENGKTYRQENMGIAVHGQYQNDTGNDKDTRYYQVSFEVLTCYHPPMEQK